MARVFVTGCSGAVGRPVCRELERAGHIVQGFDRLPTDELAQFTCGDLTDASAVRMAMRGCDHVVHLAAQAHDRPFPELIGPNLLGLFHVLDAAREHGIKAVTLASSIQVLGRRHASGVARVTEASPSNHYALTKLWAEQMGRMYTERFGLDVLAVRIAWMVRDQAEAKHMVELDRPELFLSARDAGRFFRLAVEQRVPGFQVVFAGSLGSEKVFDLEPAERLLGYTPLDRWPEGLDFTYPIADTGPQVTPTR